MPTRQHGISYILDNGAYTAKFGSSDAKNPRLIPNCIMKVKSERRRPFIGDEINDCVDTSGLYYLLPFQRGYLTNWDVQKTVWDYTFTNDAKLNEIPICITEPIMNFQPIQEAMDEIFFEEYDCCGVLRLTSTDLSAYYYNRFNDRLETCLVIDSGYSFTHIVPYINGKKYYPAIKRLDVGGKILTNHLKEVISYRQLNVMDETFVINEMKEDSCFVSTNFLYDMQIAGFKDSRNTIRGEYVLPDYNKVRRGFFVPNTSHTQLESNWENQQVSSNIDPNDLIMDLDVKNLNTNPISHNLKPNATNYFENNKSQAILSKCATLPLSLHKENIEISPRNSNDLYRNASDYFKSVNNNDRLSESFISFNNEASPANYFEPKQFKSNVSITSDMQTIKLNNERITVPEILFHPSDIGIMQKGIPETVIECVNDCPSDLKYHLLANILVTGGNANFKNFRDRLFIDVRKYFDENININVTVPFDPVTFSWDGGKYLTNTDSFYKLMVTKQDYEEYGSSLVNIRLNNFCISL